MGIHLLPPLFKIIMAPVPVPPVSGTRGGYLWNYNGVYTTVHNAANAVAAYNDQLTTRVGQRRITANLNVPEIWRADLEHDLSGIAPGRSIIKATLEVYLQTVRADNAWSLVVVSNSGLSYPLVVGDYGDMLASIISHGSISSVDMVQGAYNTIEINAVGLGEIIAGGTVILGLRSSRDINSQDPTNDHNEYVDIDTNTGVGSNPPKLTVEYEG